jgi:hypothetical protein
MIRHCRIVAYFATRKSLRKGNVLSAILENLGAHKKTMPRSWGHFDRERNTYDRGALLEAIGKLRGDENELFIKRKSKIKYEIQLTLRNRPLNHLIVEFDEDDARDSEDFSRIMSTVDDIAARLEPEFGCLQPMIPDDRYYDHNKLAAAYTFGELQKNGPFGLAARNWLGPHMMKLFGDIDWARCGVNVRREAWGGQRIDLVADLEAAEIEHLVQAEQCIKELLAPTGVLATYNGPFHKRGQNWQAIPEG